MPDALILLSLLAVTASIFVWAQRAAVTTSDQKTVTAATVHEVGDVAALDEALGSERAVLYKHSTRCPVSAVIIDEVLRFAETHPDWKICVLNVIEQRHLSDDVSWRLGVRHESPQVFVVKGGRCVWHASHNEITVQSLSGQAV
jgi:bacillithiol system protein YtxJ